MANVGFPQKSTFGTLTATLLNVATINNPAGDLALQRGGVIGITLMNGLTRSHRHVRLSTDRELQDDAGNVLIAGDNVGSIDQLAPIIDPAGVQSDLFNSVTGSLRLQRMGVDGLQLGNGYLRVMKNLRLETNVELQDISTNPILAGDNAGHIDQLSRVDIPFTNPTGSQEVTLSPQDLVGDGQSGTLHEGLGYWSITNADDRLYLWLNTVFNYLMLLGTVHVETITVYMSSDHNDVYIKESTFAWYSADDSVETDSVVDPTDIGNGSQGNENGTMTVNTALVADHFYRLDYDCEGTLGNLKIRAIKIKYRLT